MVAEEGANAPFRGIAPIMARSLPYTMVQLSTFETITGAIYSNLDLIGVTNLGLYKFGITVLAASIAALFASLASQPGDVLLTLCNQEARAAVANPIDIMVEGVRKLGIAGLFVGTKARLLHVGTIVVLQLLAYDFVKTLCGIPVTGAH